MNAAADAPDQGATARVIDASAAQIAQARAEGFAEGEQKGRAEAVKTERTRCAAILGAEAAKGREAMAHFCAFETDMSADQAVAMMGKAPALEATAPAMAAQSPLDRAMSKFAGPVGADAQPAVQSASIDFGGIYAARQAAVAAARK
ncbi:hypothetical protein [Rhodopseudomonas faecalis]|uniref:hypothetical protein n=1 Tax=Rhodopseudomonas faecalis TaxID=99655 RepID=UPI0011B4D4F4|nr:hypothetical protein [Rhodopseudomonas faecalis]